MKIYVTCLLALFCLKKKCGSKQWLWEEAKKIVEIIFYGKTTCLFIKNIIESLCGNNSLKLLIIHSLDCFIEFFYVCKRLCFLLKDWCFCNHHKIIGILWIILWLPNSRIFFFCFCILTKILSYYVSLIWLHVLDYFDRWRLDFFPLTIRESNFFSAETFFSVWPDLLLNGATWCFINYLLENENLCGNSLISNFLLSKLRYMMGNLIL